MILIDHDYKKVSLYIKANTPNPSKYHLILTVHLPTVHMGMGQDSSFKVIPN